MDNDPICNRFVEAWKSGQKPRIEDYLGSISAAEQNVLLLKLLHLELSLRRQDGESPILDSYVSRFPAHHETVARAFSLFDLCENSHSTHDLHCSFNTETYLYQTAEAAPVDQRPMSIRYHKICKLGEGAFGAVWLAEDSELKRRVALKEPRPDRLRTVSDIQNYLAEAQVLASLDHPHIVPVYDAGRTEDGSCYVVSKLIEGTDLAHYIREKSLTFAQSAILVAQIADALQHTHNRGLIHRDVKPANILIDTQNSPFVTDFGLALHDEELGKQEGIAGTPAYMSPEQARGESHMVDGRSDIFSLGIVLYELLTGIKPFHGKNWREILKQITSVEARPLRQLNDAIPKELERICLKTLSKRASDRYACAADLAEELRNWSNPAFADHAELAPLRIVPRGLRSFDESDSDFFLELLPGPRDRDGLPEALRFWKTHIEETDPNRTFRVGLVYGPSGCGKSSLMKAGLLPRLSDHVIRIFVEATSDQTVQQLLHGLRRACSDLPSNASLTDSLTAIRRGKGIPAGRKVVIVVDQFEQWLYNCGAETNPELVDALRQCDGGRAQAVLLVRDDFWMPITEFFQSLEVKLLEGHNAHSVSLFDPQHARKVLAEFGKSYGRLPEDLSQLSPDQDLFLTQSITELSQNGKVIPVRMALFSEMMKSRPWTPAALKEVGGISGVGATFLEEMFSTRLAPPQYLQHQVAARSVLQSLLPATGTDIKGHMRSVSELQEACGYAGRPQEFAELIRILDTQVRLITPVITEEELETRELHNLTDNESDVFDIQTQTPHYQLTHDYLVPSLRKWLNRKQRETWRGRAELRLEERADSWIAKPENKQLPTLWEFANIRFLTDRSRWSEKQQTMMRHATRLHSLRSVMAAGMILVLAAVAMIIRDDVARQRESLRIDGLIRQLESAEPNQIKSIVNELNAEVAEASLRELLNSDVAAERIRAAMALLPNDPSMNEILTEHCYECELSWIQPLLEHLRRFGSVGKPEDLIARVRNGANPSTRLRAAAALAAIERSAAIWDGISQPVAQWLLEQDSFTIGEYWGPLLRPVAEHLASPLATEYQSNLAKREIIRQIVVDYYENAPNELVLFASIFEADDAQRLYPIMKRQKSQCVEALSLRLDEIDTLRKHHDNKLPLEVREWQDEQTSNIVTTLFELGERGPAWNALRGTTRQQTRSFLIRRLSDSLKLPDQIYQQASSESDTYARRGLILILGNYARRAALPKENLPGLNREMIRWLQNTYASDSDPGIHSSTAWALRQIGQLEDSPHLPHDLTSEMPSSPTWRLNVANHVMVRIPGPITFLAGSPETEIGRVKWENQHRRLIPRSFEIATCETSVDHFLRFRPEYQYNSVWAPSVDCPAGSLSWYDAANYCNWLSKMEKIPEEQWCYPVNFRPEMKPYDDFLERTGYRLPTEAEWEYAARAGSSVSYSFGDSPRLLHLWAFFLGNSERRAWPVGSLMPNDLGLHDMYGNGYEWCADHFQEQFELDLQPLVDVNHFQRMDRVEATTLINLRGGSAQSPHNECRSAIRNRAPANTASTGMTFRVARTITAKDGLDDE